MGLPIFLFCVCVYLGLPPEQFFNQRMMMMTTTTTIELSSLSSSSAATSGDIKRLERVPITITPNNNENTDYIVSRQTDRQTDSFLFFSRHLCRVTLVFLSTAFLWRLVVDCFSHHRRLLFYSYFIFLKIHFVHSMVTKMCLSLCGGSVTKGRAIISRGDARCPYLFLCVCDDCRVQKQRLETVTLAPNAIDRWRLIFY